MVVHQRETHWAYEGSMNFMVKLELTQCQKVAGYFMAVKGTNLHHPAGAKAYFFNVQVYPNAAEEERLLQIYHQDRSQGRCPHAPEEGKFQYSLNFLDMPKYIQIPDQAGETM